MKKISIVFFVMAAFIQNCSQSPQSSSAANAPTQITAQDTLEQSIISDLTSIHHNLELVRKAHGLIGQQHSEVPDQHAEILQSIGLINSLLENNEQKIASLNSQRTLLNKKNKALAQLIEETTRQLQQQQQEILTLKQELALGEFKITDLAIKMDEIEVENEKLREDKLQLENQNAQFDLDINRVFVTYGTEQELIEKGIAQKRRIQSSKRLSLSSTFTRNRSFFVDEDKRSLKEIPVSGKSARLLSLHPEDSYTITCDEQGYCKIVITNMQDFWSISNYLVIQVSN